MSAQPSASAGPRSTKLAKVADDAPDAVATLQNQWYNTLAAAVASNGNFQIIQPNAPIPPAATDDLIWAYFNNLAPATLTSDLTLSAGDQFYSNYEGVVSQLQSNTLAKIQSAIGSYYPLWDQYLMKLSPEPTSAQLPGVFFNWAEINAAPVAGAGRSAYEAALLDPIYLAEVMVQNTSGFVNNTPNFTQGVSQLFQQIPGGPSGAVTFDSNTASSNVSNTWAQGDGGSFFGIFGEGDSSSSDLSQTFASAQVTVSVSFDNLFTFVSAPPGAPNGWYSSEALSQAYAAQGGGAPWSANPNPNWNSTFGADGDMQYFVASLIVANGITATIKSAAEYSAAQQTQITQESSSGFWPFYWGSGSSTSTTNVQFNEDNTMTYTVSSPTGSPVVIGALVLPASAYLAG